MWSGENGLKTPAQMSSILDLHVYWITWFFKNKNTLKTTKQKITSTFDAFSQDKRA